MGYKTGKELVEEWGLRDFELLAHVRTGLQPLNNFGRPIPPPDISIKISVNRGMLERLRTELSRIPWPALPSSDKIHTAPYHGRNQFMGDILQREQSKPRREYLLKEIKATEEELDDIKNKFSWADYELPEDEKSAQRVIDLLQKALFEWEEDTEREGEKDSHEKNMEGSCVDLPLEPSQRNVSILEGETEKNRKPNSTEASARLIIIEGKSKKRPQWQVAADLKDKLKRSDYEIACDLSIDKRHLPKEKQYDAMRAHAARLVEKGRKEKTGKK